MQICMSLVLLGCTCPHETSHNILAAGIIYYQLSSTTYVFPSHVLGELDTSFILQEAEGRFRTYNNRVLAVVAKGFKTMDNFDEEKIVKILFEETFFLDESRYINVSLHFPAAYLFHRLLLSVHWLSLTTLRPKSFINILNLGSA